jgi:hypothetical protein
MTAQKKDLFDIISPDSDVFDGIEQEESSIERLKKEMVSTLEKFDTKERKEQNRRLSEEMKDFIRGEIAKIKPVQNVIEKTIQTKIESVPVHIEPKVVVAPPQIIKEVRVEVPKKDDRQLVELAQLKALKDEIEALRTELKETRRRADSPVVLPGGSGVIGIPPPEAGADGQVLTISNRKAAWKAATGGGGGTSSDAYTPTNVTTDRAFDATDTSLDELANVVGSLIASLQGAGIIQ